MTKGISKRFLALFLYLQSVPAFKYCFTTTLFVILLIYKIENSPDATISLEFSFLVKIVVLLTFLFVVSYPLTRYVVNIATFLKVLLISGFLSLLIVNSKSNKVLEDIVKVQSSTNMNVEVEGNIESVDGTKSVLRSSLPKIGDILVKESGVTVLQPGLYCKISGYLVEPESFNEFDYKGYLKHKGIYSILNAKEIKCEQRNFSLKRVRYWIESKYKRILPEPQSSLLVGILLGSDQQFTKEFEESIRNAGVSHVIAASGYNISILVVACKKMFGFLNRKGYLISSLILIWMFTFLSGFAPSLLRATVMSSMYLLSDMFGRKGNGGVVLIYALTFLTVLNPYILFDIGFMLSFASTLSLTLFLPCIEKISKSKYLRSYLFPTFSCTIFALPISMYYFKTVSLVSVVTNMLVLPILEQTLLWGLLILPTYSFTNFFVNGTKIQLSIFISIIEYISKVKILVVEFNPVVLCIAIYFLLGIFILYRYPILNIKRNFYVKKSVDFFK